MEMLGSFLEKALIARTALLKSTLVKGKEEIRTVKSVKQFKSLDELTKMIDDESDPSRKEELGLARSRAIAEDKTDNIAIVERVEGWDDEISDEMIEKVLKANATLVKQVDALLMQMQKHAATHSTGDENTLVHTIGTIGGDLDGGEDLARDLKKVLEDFAQGLAKSRKQLKQAVVRSIDDFSRPERDRAILDPEHEQFDIGDYFLDDDGRIDRPDLKQARDAAFASDDVDQIREDIDNLALDHPDLYEQMFGDANPEQVMNHHEEGEVGRIYAIADQVTSEKAKERYYDLKPGPDGKLHWNPETPPGAGNKLNRSAMRLRAQPEAHAIKVKVPNGAYILAKTKDGNIRAFPQKGWSASDEEKDDRDGLDDDIIQLDSGEVEDAIALDPNMAAKKGKPPFGQELGNKESSRGAFINQLRDQRHEAGDDLAEFAIELKDLIDSSSRNPFLPDNQDADITKRFLAGLLQARDAKRTHAILNRFTSDEGFERMRSLAMDANGDEASANKQVSKLYDLAKNIQSMIYDEVLSRQDNSEQGAEDEQVSDRPQDEEDPFSTDPMNPEADLEDKPSYAQDQEQGGAPELSFGDSSPEEQAVAKDRGLEIRPDDSEDETKPEIAKINVTSKMAAQLTSKARASDEQVEKDQIAKIAAVLSNIPEEMRQQEDSSDHEISQDVERLLQAPNEAPPQVAMKTNTGKQAAALLKHIDDKGITSLKDLKPEEVVKILDIITPPRPADSEQEKEPAALDSSGGYWEDDEEQQPEEEEDLTADLPLADPNQKLEIMGRVGAALKELEQKEDSDRLAFKGAAVDSEMYLARSTMRRLWSALRANKTFDDAAASAHKASRREFEQRPELLAKVGKLLDHWVDELQTEGAPLTVPDWVQGDQEDNLTGGDSSQPEQAGSSGSNVEQLSQHLDALIQGAPEFKGIRHLKRLKEGLSLSSDEMLKVLRSEEQDTWHNLFANSAKAGGIDRDAANNLATKIVALLNGVLEDLQSEGTGVPIIKQLEKHPVNKEMEKLIGTLTDLVDESEADVKELSNQLNRLQRAVTKEELIKPLEWYGSDSSYEDMWRAFIEVYDKDTADVKVPRVQEAAQRILKTIEGLDLESSAAVPEDKPGENADTKGGAAQKQGPAESATAGNPYFGTIPRPYSIMAATVGQKLKRLADRAPEKLQPQTQQAIKSFLNATSKEEFHKAVEYLGDPFSKANFDFEKGLNDSDHTEILKDLRQLTNMDISDKGDAAKDQEPVKYSLEVLKQNPESKAQLDTFYSAMRDLTDKVDGSNKYLKQYQDVAVQFARSKDLEATERLLTWISDEGHDYAYKAAASIPNSSELDAGSMAAKLSNAAHKLLASVIDYRKQKGQSAAEPSNESNKPLRFKIREVI